jgi:hypothetical protein
MKLSARSPLVGVAALSLLLGTAHTGAAEPQRRPREPRPERKAKTPPPKPAAAPPAATPQPRFEFEKQAGALEQALTVLLDRQRAVLPRPEGAGEQMTRAAAARQAVRSNPAAAAATIIAELEKLPKDDVEGHAELFRLLDVVADQDAVIEYWSKKLSSGTPRPPRPAAERQKLKEPDQPRLRKSEHEDPEALIRTLAITHLYRAARAGNEKARAAILEAAASPHPEVRISAVQYTYALTRQRWKARQELEKRLPRTDHYLLHRY